MIAISALLVFTLGGLSQVLARFVIPMMGRVVGNALVGIHLTHSLGIELGLLSQVFGGGPSELLLNASISTFLITTYFVARGDPRATNWDRMIGKLDSRVAPNSGFWTPRIQLLTDKRKQEFISQLDDLPRDESEILVLLKQTTLKKPPKGSKTRAYSTTDLQAQIQTLVQSSYYKQHSERFRWIVLVTRTGRFVAYQSFDSFYATLIGAKRQEYENILNTNDIDDFVARLVAHEEDEDWGQRGYPGPDDLPSLRFDYVWEKRKRKEVILRLISCARDHTMLVDRKKRPVGVVGIRAIIDKNVMDDLVMTHEEREAVKSQFPPDCDEDYLSTSPTDSDGEIGASHEEVLDLDEETINVEDDDEVEETSSISDIPPASLCDGTERGAINEAEAIQQEVNPEMASQTAMLEDGA